MTYKVMTEGILRAVSKPEMSVSLTSLDQDERRWQGEEYRWVRLVRREKCAGRVPLKAAHPASLLMR